MTLPAAAQSAAWRAEPATTGQDAPDAVLQGKALPIEPVQPKGCGNCKYPVLDGTGGRIASLFIACVASHTALFTPSTASRQHHLKRYFSNFRTPKRAAHYLWAVLIARIYQVFPLLCPLCGGQMRIIAFITHSAEIRQLLDHIGVASEPPRISPARGPPRWEDGDAQMGEGVQVEPDWDLAAQPAPDFEVNQRVNW